MNRVHIPGKFLGPEDNSSPPIVQRFLVEFALLTNPRPPHQEVALFSLVDVTDDVPIEVGEPIRINVSPAVLGVDDEAFRLEAIRKAWVDVGEVLHKRAMLKI